MSLADGRGGINHVVREGDRVVRWPLSGGPSAFEKDVWCCPAAVAAGVAAPEEVVLGSRDGQTSCSHRFVPGEELPETTESWRLLGELAARIARITPDDAAPASLFTRFGRDLERAWRSHLAYNLDALTATDPLLSAGAYAPHQQDAIRERLAWLAGRPCPQGLAHGDLRPANVIASPDGPVVIDWECAEFGPVPGRDLVGVIDHERAGRSPAGATQAFLAGWAAEWGSPLTADEVSAHELLSRLDLVRWAVDRCPERIDELAGTCRDRLPHLLSPREDLP